MGLAYHPQEGMIDVPNEYKEAYRLMSEQGLLQMPLSDEVAQRC